MSEIDLTLALQLQAQFEEELRVSLLKQQEEEQKHGIEGTPIFLELHNKKNTGKPLEEPQQEKLSVSLVDPSWELIDPNPDIHTLFLTFNDQFFWGRLARVEVRWSPRMTLCAGVCSYEGRGGLCSVRLSLPLLKLRPRKDLVDTLLHEMIHAYLFVTANNRDRDGHGPEFHKHMYRINSVAGTNITVFHTFHDEVDVYRQHIWQCDGPCRTRKPYFGLLKRSMNRAPGPRDHWWERHQQACGGTYRKIQEPDSARAAKKGGSAASKKSDGCSDIRKFMNFTGKSNSLGEVSSKPSHSKDSQSDSSKENTPEPRLDKRVESRGQHSLNGSQEKQNNIQGFTNSSSDKVSQISVAGASHSKVHGFGSHSPARKKPRGGNGMAAGKVSGGKSMVKKNPGGSGTTGLAVRGGGSQTITVRGKTAARTKTHVREDSSKVETDTASRVAFQGQGYTLGGADGKVSKLLSVSASSQVRSTSEHPSTSSVSNTSKAPYSGAETSTCSNRDKKVNASCSSVLPAKGNTPQKIHKSLDCYIVTPTSSQPAGKTVKCPVCNAVVPEREINKHLDECISSISDDVMKDEAEEGSCGGAPSFAGRETVDAGGTSSHDTSSGRELSGASSPDECLEGGEAEHYTCPVCRECCSSATINHHLDSHF